MVKVIRRVLRRPETVPPPPRHRIGRLVLSGNLAPLPRSHPWFELRAQRAAELGQYR